MITIPAPVKAATQQHCEWLRPRRLEGCIIQVPPVVKLRHAKVVVSRQCAQKKPVVAHALVPVSHRLVFVFPEKTLWRNIGGVWMACSCCCLGPLLSFVGQMQAVVLIRS